MSTPGSILVSGDGDEREIGWGGLFRVLRRLVRRLVVVIRTGCHLVFPVIMPGRVAEALSGLMWPHVLLNNVTLPTADGTTQIDQILVVDTGIFIIETKHYSGWIFGKPSEELWTQTIFRKRSRFRNPLRQNYGHVRTIQSLFNLPEKVFHGLVVFTGKAELKTDLGSHVLQIGELLDFLYREREVVLRPLLAHEDYAPLRATGDGLQHVYLTTISIGLAGILLGLAGADAAIFRGGVLQDGFDSMVERQLTGIQEWEDIEQRRIADADLPNTTRTALIKARVGQGLFKERVGRIERACRITFVDNPAHLVGSHIKPWRECTNDERLEGANGLPRRRIVFVLRPRHGTR